MQNRPPSPSPPPLPTTPNPVWSLVGESQGRLISIVNLILQSTLGDCCLHANAHPSRKADSQVLALTGIPRKPPVRREPDNINTVNKVN